MVLYDLECSKECGHEELGIFREFRCYGPCPDCGAPRRPLWLPRGHRPFKEFDVEVDGAVRRFTSLQQVRRFEAETVRAGSPSIFRAFSQDGSKQDVNALENEGRKFEPHATRTSRGVPFVDKDAVLKAHGFDPERAR